MMDLKHCQSWLTQAFLRPAVIFQITAASMYLLLMWTCESASKVLLEIANTSFKASCDFSNHSSYLFLFRTQMCESGSEVLSEVADTGFLIPAVIFRVTASSMYSYWPTLVRLDPKYCQKTATVTPTLKTQAWESAGIFRNAADSICLLRTQICKAGSKVLSEKF